MKKNIFGLVALSLIIISCSKSLFITNQLPSNSKSIALNDYNLYILQLKKINDTVKTDHTKIAYPRIANINHENPGLIYEELYLLIDKKENHCYYLSSFSHKYILKDGVFNSRNYENSYYLNDLDYVFYGNIKDSIITFRNEAMIGPNTKQDIKISFSKTSEYIEFKSMTNDNPSKKERDKNDTVLVDTIFSTDFTFIKSQRSMKYRNKCYIEGKVDSISFLYNDAYFKTDILNYKYIKLKDRFKY